MTLLRSALHGLRVTDVMTVGVAPAVFEPQTPLPTMLERASVAERQEVFRCWRMGKWWDW